MMGLLIKTGKVDRYLFLLGLPHSRFPDPRNQGLSHQKSSSRAPARLAQLAEHGILDLGVVSSRPMLGL